MGTNCSSCTSDFKNQISKISESCQHQNIQPQDQQIMSPQKLISARHSLKIIIDTIKRSSLNKKRRNIQQLFFIQLKQQFSTFKVKSSEVISNTECIRLVKDRWNHFNETTPEIKEYAKSMLQFNSSYSTTLSLVKAYHINYIKKEQINFYARMIQNKNVDLSDEFDCLFTWRPTRSLEQIFLHEKSSMLKLNSYRSNDFLCLIRRFLFFSHIKNMDYLDNTKTFHRYNIDSWYKILSKYNYDKLTKTAIQKYNNNNEEIIDNSNEIFFFNQDAEGSCAWKEYDLSWEESNTLADVRKDQKKKTRIKSLKGTQTIPMKVVKLVKNINKEQKFNNSVMNLLSIGKQGETTSKSSENNENSKMLGKAKSLYERYSGENTADITRNEKGGDVFYYNGFYDISTWLPCFYGETISKDHLSYYIGTSRYNQKHGVGNFYTSDPGNISYYQGEYDKNKRNGYGIHTTIQDNVLKVYTGIFISDCFSSGTIEELNLKYKNKHRNTVRTPVYSKYEGEINLNNQMMFEGFARKTEVFQGMNKLITKVYQGYFIGGLENDTRATVKYCDNNNFIDSYEYFGSFKDGKKHGYGRIEYTSNYYIKSYEGLFENDQILVGYGIVEFRSGDIYEGFLNDKRWKCGVGWYLHRSDECNDISKGKSLEGGHKKEKKYFRDNFFGHYLNDQKEGIGRFVNHKDKKLQFGIYSKGEKEGKFTIIEYKNVKQIQVFKYNFFFKNDAVCAEVNWDCEAVDEREQREKIIKTHNYKV